MGVDYRLKIFRKVDNKLLGIVDANHLKSILDSSFSNIINCDDRNCDKVKFEVKDLEKLVEKVNDKIDRLYSSITEKKLMISLSKTTEIKNELEEDIFYIRDEIKEYKYVISSAYILQGLINCVSESLWNKEDTKSAYEYNGEDLPKKQKQYLNGETYESPVYIWESDVYCEIEANW